MVHSKIFVNHQYKLFKKTFAMIMSLDKVLIPTFYADCLYQSMKVIALFLFLRFIYWILEFFRQSDVLIFNFFFNIL
jgi:hypothetical protein